MYPPHPPPHPANHHPLANRYHPLPPPHTRARAHTHTHTHTTPDHWCVCSDLRCMVPQTDNCCPTTVYKHLQCMSLLINVSGVLRGHYTIESFYDWKLWFLLWCLSLFLRLYWCFFFSCDQAALCMVFSVRSSVRLSHLFEYVSIIVSSWNFQKLSPRTRVRSMQKVKVRVQRSRSQRSQPNLTVSGL